MMQVRCQHCGWSFTLGRDAIGLAVVEAEHQHDTHYLFSCPKCRHGVKIQVKQLRQRLPPDYQFPDLPQRHAPISVKKDEEPEAIAPTTAQVAPEPMSAPEPATPPAAKSNAETVVKPKPAAKSGAKTAPKSKVTTKTTTTVKKTVAKKK